MDSPGKIILFGSGETSTSGRRVYDFLFRSMADPVRVAVLETPAGFELNSEWVASQVVNFLLHRLRNYAPDVCIVSARKRGTAFSPDDPEIVKPLLSSNVIYMGAGSPTYAVKQLKDSLTWNTLIVRHRMGAHLVWASAAPLAVSAYTIPVYEIYKVGEEPEWRQGLDFFKPYGLSLVFVPHWNNSEGGANLDTSRCFMGISRFSQLLSSLPEQVAIVGIEEHTALIIDMVQETCHIMGKGGVILLHGNEERRYEENDSFPIQELGTFHIPELIKGIPEEVVRSASQAKVEAIPLEVPSGVYMLLAQREAARKQKDWEEADHCRDEILRLGWAIQDTEHGPELVPLEE